MERLAEFGRAKAEEDARDRKWLRPIGFVTRLLIYAALFLALYSCAPKDISHTPIGSLTPSDIGGTVAFVAIAILLGRALFNPSQDDEVKDAWGWLGVVVIGLAVFGGVFLLKR
jgi:hypothetical protein